MATNWHTPPADGVLIIAEIGVNHNGAADTGRRLIDAAAAAGADAVKLQYFNSDRLLSAQAELAGYQRRPGAGAAPASARELLRPLALTIDDIGLLCAHAAAAGLARLVTPFSPGDCPELATLNLDALKIASPDCVNTLLLDAAAATGLPLLISTGAAELDELHDAAAAVRWRGGALLQCVSAYPTPAADASLGGIRALDDFAADALGVAVPVGYSDHTAAEATGAAAVAAGARVLEKHLTLDRDAPGPDHAASLEPDALARYVAAARAAEPLSSAELRLPRVKAVLPIEADVRRVSRQSVAAARHLLPGHRLAAIDLTVMRPGTGIPVRRLTSLVGQTLTEEVPAGHLIPEQALLNLD